MAAKDGKNQAKRTSYPISFRISGRHLKQLDEGAAQHNMSVHEYARLKLTELLDRQEELRLLEEAQATRRSVEELRADVANTLEVILLNTTGGNAAEIRSWIDQYLRFRR